MTNIKKLFFVLIVWLSFAFVSAAAFACNFTFDVSLVSVTVDAARSAQNTLGFDNWYVWKYRVDVVEGSNNRSALSNWVLQLPDCYITSKDLFKEIEASAGSAGGDQSRTYISSAVNPDPNLNFKGLKWEWKNSCWWWSLDQLDQEGEYDYFWFSAPTDLSIDGDWGVKAGQNKIYGDVEVPDCPGCHDPGVPEPVSSILFSVGLAGLWKRRRQAFLKK